MKEVHRNGYVVVGDLNALTLRVGDKLVVFEKPTWRWAFVESMELNDVPAEQVLGDGATEVGLKLTRRAQLGTNICRLQSPSVEPADTQLQFEQTNQETMEAADTDLSDGDAATPVSEEVRDADGTGPPA